MLLKQWTVPKNHRKYTGEKHKRNHSETLKEELFIEGEIDGLVSRYCLRVLRQNKTPEAITSGVFFIECLLQGSSTALRSHV